MEPRPIPPLEFSGEVEAFQESQVQENWMEDAECRGLDPAIFVLEKGQSPNPARAICHFCNVKVECLDYAMENRLHGVYAGLTDKQRTRLRHGYGIRKY